MAINKEWLKEELSKKGSKLSLAEKDLTDKDIVYILKLLKKHPHVVELDLSGNDITVLDEDALSELHLLNFLDLSGNNGFGEQGCQSLKKGKFKILDISNNAIGEGVKAFTEINVLEELTARCCDLNDAQAAILFLSPSIETLSLENNKLDGSFLEDIDKTKMLKNLYLPRNKLLQEHNLKFILKSTSLECLDLSNDKLTTIGISILAQSTSLTELILIYCKITDINAFANKKCSIKILNVENNQITGEGIKNLYENNTLIKILLLGNNGILFSKEEAILKGFYESDFGGSFTRSDTFIKEKLPNLLKKMIVETSLTSDSPLSSTPLKRKSVSEPEESPPKNETEKDITQVLKRSKP